MTLFKWLFGWLPRRKRRIENRKKVVNLEKSPQDKRDYNYQQKSLIDKKPPLKVDLSGFITEIKHQGNIGSCASFAIATALETEHKILNPGISIPLSERYHYWWVRQIGWMGTFPGDSGQYIREGLKCGMKKGVAPESLCVYDTKKFNKKPSLLAESFAKRWFLIKSFHRCDTLISIKSALAGRHLVVFGVPVDRKFLVFKGKGVINDYSVVNKVGGHAMCIVGYDEEKKAFRIVNSWGRGWGDKGFAWINYDYIKKYLWEAWSLRT